MDNLNIKLLEWVGWRYGIDEADPKNLDELWFPPYSTGCRQPPPDFTCSLDECFRWLVPKVAKSLELTVTFHRCHGAIWSCVLTTYKGDIAVEPASHHDPAMALCRAIDKLIN